LAVDIYNLREHEYDPITVRQGAKYNGLGIEGTTYVSNLVTNNVLQYIKSVNEKHNFDALAGYSLEKYDYRTTYIEGIDFPNEEFQYIESAGTIRAASASATGPCFETPGSGNSGIITCINTFSVCRPVRTAPLNSEKNTHYGYFPSASFAWRMSEEPFIKKHLFH